MQRRARLELRLGGILLAISMLLGGGGSGAPIQEGMVQLAAVAIAMFLGIRGRLAIPRGDPALWQVVAIICMVPLVQLIPLPPEIWRSLPGRAVAAESLNLIGHSDDWRPLSLFPIRTLSAFLSLLPPLLMLYLVSRMPEVDRHRMLGMACLAALASALLGVMQLAGGKGSAFYLYEFTHRGFSTGFFANRNAQADMLLMGIVTTSAWFALRLGNQRSFNPMLLLVGVLLLLMVSIITTGSRSGMALLAVALAGASLIFMASRWTAPKIILLLLGFTLLGGVIYNNPVVQRSLMRFQELEDARPAIWEDTAFAVSQYFPVGSGIGTFVPIFRAAERLELIHGAYVNRAHNDYLETLLEGGLITAAVLLIFFVFLVVRAGSLVFWGGRFERVSAICAGACWLLLGLHSFVDYPLRNQALMVLSALFVGLIAKKHPNEAGDRRGSGSASKTRGERPRASEAEGGT